MGSFYSRLSYSFGNEDWKTEHQALKIQPSDRVVCITASGDRPLNLLTSDCKEILALDTNPIQNHLLCLKKTALQELPYDEYLAFLGATQTRHRRDLFEKLKSQLPKDSLNYWQQHQANLINGVLYEGAVEKRLKILSHLIRMVRRKKIERLFSFNDIAKQKDFVQKSWDSKSWRKLFDISLHPSLTKIFIKDPGLYEHLEDSMHVGKYIYQRMHSSLERFLAKENIILSLCLKGEVDQLGYPPYLNKEDSKVIKSRLDRVSLKTIDLLRYLESAKENSIDCFSLSDVASYMDYANFKRLLKAVHRCAKPDARFCIRQFLTRYSVPKEYESFFCRDSLLEEKLEKEDRCFVYRFFVGTVIKG